MRTDANLSINGLEDSELSMSAYSMSSSKSKQKYRLPDYLQSMRCEEFDAESLAAALADDDDDNRDLNIPPVKDMPNVLNKISEQILID